MAQSIEEIEEAKKSWEDHLLKFKENYYPTFASFGLSFEAAYAVYNNNVLHNSISDLIESLRDEGWE